MPVSLSFFWLLLFTFDILQMSKQRQPGGGEDSSNFTESVSSNFTESVITCITIPLTALTSCTFQLLL